MPGRSVSNGSGYRYGFNGKEQDNEVKEEGNQQDYGMRIYDPRLGRFLSVDPLQVEYPWNSPYAFAENDVIRSIDLDGLERYVVTYWYNSSGEVTRTTIKSIRERSTRHEVELNFRRANGNKLTTKDVHIRHLYTNGRIREKVPDKNTLTPNEQRIYNKARSGRDSRLWVEYDLGDQRGGIDIKSDRFNSRTHEYNEASERQFIQKGSVLGAVGTTETVGNEKNGTIHLEYPQAAEFKQLIKDIRSDGGYENGTVTITLNVNNVNDQQYAIFQKGVKYVGEQFKKLLENAGVKNVNVDAQATRDQPSTNAGLKIKVNN